MLNTTPIKTAILGQGRSGYGIHYAWLRQVPELFQIVAVADLLPERCTEAANEFGAECFPDYRELLANNELEIDLIINALPSFLHPQATLDSLTKNYHVVCEKPLARTVADFDQMVHTSEKVERLLLPFQNSRFVPYFTKLQEVLASGKLGRIINIRLNWSGYARRWDWQTIQEFWGGNLLNTGPHPVDHAVVLFGDQEPGIFCKLVSDNPFGDAENHCQLTLYGENAPIVDVVVSSLQAYPQGDTVNVSGTLGGLTGGSTGLKWKYFDPKNAPEHVFNGSWSDKRGYCQEDLDWIEESWSNTSKRDLFDQMCKSFYEDVYRLLVEGGNRIIKLDQVRRQIKIMEECHRQNPMPQFDKMFLK